MRPDDVRELLGGYATGTLTERERKLLFEAALDDQRLFDALADEEALRELLSDQAYRRELVKALEEEPTVSEKLTAWWRRPLPLALAGGVAAMAMALVILIPRPESGVEVRDVAILRPRAETAPIEEALETAPSAEETRPGAAKSIFNKDEDAAAVGGLKRKQFAPPEAPAAAPPREPARRLQKKASVAEPKKELAQDTGRADERRATLVRQRPAVASVIETDEAFAREDLAEVRNEPAASGLSSQVGAVQPEFGAYRAATGERSSLRVVVEVQTAEGNYASLAANRQVGLGVSVRLRVDTPAAGYLLVSERTEAGGPLRTVFSGAAAFDRPNYVPSNGGLPEPSESGVRTLAVLFSPRPIDADGRTKSLFYFEGRGAPDAPMLIERVSISYR